MKGTTIGVDLARRVFQVHGASMIRQVKFKKLTRTQFRRFMSEQPVCIIVFEACGSASYWAREMFHTGLVNPKPVEALLDEPDCDLPTLIVAECHDLMIPIAERTLRVDLKTKELEALAAKTDTARLLQTMPGFGPLMAPAVKAFAPATHDSNLAETSRLGWG